MSLVAQVTIYVDAAPAPGETLTDTLVTPNPVHFQPGTQQILTVEVSGSQGRRPAKGFSFQPFWSSQPSPGPSKAPIEAYRKQDWNAGHPAGPVLKDNELLIVVPADFPPSAIGAIITIQGT